MRFYPNVPDVDTAGTLVAWRRFTRNGAIDPCVRPHVRDAWLRSSAHECSPFMARADVLSPVGTIDLLKREARLIEIVSPFLSSLSRAAGAERHAAMLADGSGRVLKIAADELTAADETFPRAGSLLSEAAAGANGIGTALAGGRYVELVGPEHFIEGFHRFTCQGVPLQLSAGVAAGVLSTSVRRLDAARRIRDILFCASEAAECELLSAQLLEAASGGTDPSGILELLRQDVVQRIAITRLHLELAARRIASCADASEVLQTAEQLTQTFRRQAAVWRNLADDGVGSPEPIDVAELVHDFAGLMETESRVASVALVEDRLERVFAVDDVGALSRRLLSALLTAFQGATPGSALRLRTGSADGLTTIAVLGEAANGSPIELRIDAPALH